ncbi:MAG TPA: FadR/GntR family transcriptional regulator [Steroidobacteraceae bacterium]|jgi:DNA-binding FadR family transcriptional regulator|nr:FadR/GntR family transcriptional regulator [Steroidobacteraceae bacterium]HNS27106.1 FadR/GntR family transcriptional regulator [Steroidobacteraceae bacterium]
MKKAPHIAPRIVPVIKREGLPEQIVRQLVGLVKSGHLKPGDRLPAERTLAEELGVGRPTLREALRALQLLGIVDIRHGGGVFVTGLDPDTLLGPLHLFLGLDRHKLETILEARKVVEGAVLAFVARVIDDDAIARLQANLAALEAAINSQPHVGTLDVRRVNALAEEFRAIIEGAVSNPILSRAVKGLDSLTTATRNRALSAVPADRLLANHRRIVEALAQRDPAAAQRALEAHIDYLGEASQVTLRGKT